MSSLAFIGSPTHPCQPQPLVVGTSRLQPPQLFARSTQGQSGSGRGWLLSCAATVAALIKLRKARDPERPKKPPTAYGLFIKDFRAKNKKLTPTEAFKKAGAEWSSMAASARAEYEKEASKPKSVYTKEYKKYVDSGKHGFWVRDPSRPLKPISAALKFMWENGMRPGAALSKAWAALDAKKKAVYEKQYQTEMAKYKKAMEKYEASGSEGNWKEKVGLKAIEDKVEAKALKQKAKALKEKEKAKALKEKEKAKALKEKVKALKEKEKARALKDKEKAKALKEKEKVKALKEKEKVRALKEKEKVKALKEKEKAKALKEKEKAKALKEKEKLKALKEKAKAKAEKMAKNLKLKQATKAKAGAKVKKAAKVTA